MPDLLIELFSEEIPARMQDRAAADLKRLVTDGLVESGLTYEAAAAFSTPRRLALAVHGLTAQSPTLREERKGPRADAPDAAIEGFCRSVGLQRDQLELRDAGKAQVFFAVVERPGRPAAAIIAEVLEAAIRTFPWPKSMRWGSGTLRWVRPLQSILCILSDEAGAETVPFEIDGIRAGNTTEGHRFMSPGRFAVTGFEDYQARLKRAHVILDAQERADRIWSEATNAAFAQGLELVADKGLLAEVAGLVEWPVVLMGAIDDAFLGLPPEVLQTSMKEHQKFFSVRNPATGRIEKFVTVANRETADHGATILRGNQKVLSARLSDARFFWENDLRVVQSPSGMDEWLEGLKAVTFHNKLGSQFDRITRIAALARDIAPQVGADPDQAEQAARIAKTDLQSAMVGEFPELQGLMGSYYARAAGLPDAVADACAAHYSPLGPSDAVPSDPVSVAVALADKLDTLSGFWAIDEKPTGSKDPYALRRAALGVIRLVLGNGLRLRLAEVAFAGVALHAGLLKLVQDVVEATPAVHKHADDLNAGSSASVTRALALRKAVEKADIEGTHALHQVLKREQFDISEGQTNLNTAMEKLQVARERLEKGKVQADENATELLSFFHDRLKVFLRDQGIRHDVIDACLAMPGNDDLTLLVKRAEALTAFLGTEDGENLLQGFKRANNILTQAEEKDGVEYSVGPEPKLAEAEEEKALFEALDQAEAAILPAVRAEDFQTAMAAMARLRAPIDAFFTAVQINSDNAIVRRNRLNLLHRIRTICGGVADFGRLQG
ncbi:glycine--tRNA ligase subunit beta [Plastorhodobacter daqingensis]|uniref:Glycine--tRNA ligase beta subunit n=1 Tax=Plastorhodobacter daqingensis TaxID=1387281 RepID=A0ABW2UK57_9RHOB